MQEERVHVLIIEDEAVLAMDMCDTLEAEGYAVVGMATNGRRALDLYRQHRVDLLLCDINLKGDWDGIETITRLQAYKMVPVIYLTAFSDKETVQRAKQTFPAAYLIKPVQPASLSIAMELALHNFMLRKVPGGVAEAGKTAGEKEPSARETILRIDDQVFIKQNYQFVRILLDDIWLLEADNTYTTLIAGQHKYALRLTLNHALEKLACTNLVRVHRSFAVNLKKLQSFSEKEIFVGTFSIPIGQQYKEPFLRHFQSR